MDRFSQQKVNEKKYKDMRDSAPREEYKGDFKSDAYKEVKNQTISQTKIVQKDVFESDYKEDFDKAAKDFWQKNTQTGTSKYNSGGMSATFGKEEFTLEELLKRFGTLVKETITNELTEKKIPTDSLSENFKSLDISLKLLANSVEVLDKDMDISDVTAYLHGFINTFVTKIIKKKIERVKGNVNNV